MKALTKELDFSPIIKAELVRNGWANQAGFTENTLFKGNKSVIVDRAFKCYDMLNEVFLGKYSFDSDSERLKDFLDFLEL